MKNTHPDNIHWKPQLDKNRDVKRKYWCLFMFFFSSSLLCCFCWTNVCVWSTWMRTKIELYNIRHNPKNQQLGNCQRKRSDQISQAMHDNLHTDTHIHSTESSEYLILFITSFFRCFVSITMLRTRFYPRMLSILYMCLLLSFHISWRFVTPPPVALFFFFWLLSIEHIPHVCDSKFLCPSFFEHFACHTLDRILILLRIWQVIVIDFVRV